MGKVNRKPAPPGFRLDANQPRNLSLFHEKLRAPLDNQRFLRHERSLPGLENSHSVELTIARDLRPLLPRLGVAGLGSRGFLASRRREN